MKKTLIPFLLTAAVLCSCAFELPTIQDSSSKTPDSSIVESSLVTPESKDETSVTSDKSQSLETSTKETVTVPLFNDAVAVSLEDNSAARSSVAEAFGDILAGMDHKNVYQDNAGVKIGSSKSEGAWTLKFNHKIESVTYKARGYTKYDDYNKIWRNDSPSYKINDKAYTLEDSTNGKEEAKFIELEAEINSDTIKFETTSGRLVINSITKCSFSFICCCITLTYTV